jgi:hypothetical protein
MVGWLVCSYTLRIVFNTISCERLASIFSFFRISDAITEARFFLISLKHRDWSQVACDSQIFENYRSLQKCRIGFLIDKGCFFRFEVLRWLLHNGKWVILVFRFTYLFYLIHGNTHWLIYSFGHTYLLIHVNLLCSFLRFLSEISYF